VCFPDTFLHITWPVLASLPTSCFWHSHSSFHLHVANTTSHVYFQRLFIAMTPSTRSSIPPAKRRKLDNTADGELESATLSGSLRRPVSPPISRRKTPAPAPASLLTPAPTWGFNDVPKRTLTPPQSQPALQDKQIGQSPISARENLEKENHNERDESEVEFVASPFTLTRIRDLAPHQNIDTVQLKDILGDPLIKECWNFNFLFDLDFVM
jgi:tyrosyl-DNA phosphodiesterase 1